MIFSGSWSPLRFLVAGQASIVAQLLLETDLEFVLTLTCSRNNIRCRQSFVKGGDYSIEFLPHVLSQRMVLSRVYHEENAPSSCVAVQVGLTSDIC